MLLKTIKHKHSVEEKEETNITITESNRTDNDLFAKYADDDDDDDDNFDLDDEWKKLTGCHSDVDTEDKMIEDIDDGKIKDVIDKIDDETDDMIEEMIEDNKERTRHLDMINKQIDHINLLARIRNDFSKNIEEICRLMDELHDEIYSDDSWLRLVELS